MKNSLSALLFVLIFCSFVFGQDTSTKPTTGSGVGTGKGSGSGSGSGSGASKPVPPISNNASETPLRILSKPRPAYTDAARVNATEGIVRLRVTFLDSGEIGEVTPISGLAHGLTDQAITAARLMKFEPQKRDGKPVSVTKTVEFSFLLFFNEEDAELTQKAEIIEMPDVEHPQDSNLQNIGGKVKVLVALSSDGTAKIVQINTDLPKEFIQKVTEAVAKIKFKPAIHRNGKTVTQTKQIEYAFPK